MRRQFLADVALNARSLCTNWTCRSAALRALDARIYTESVPEGLTFDCTAAALARAGLWSLATSAGRVDVIFEPAGTGGYEDLQAGAVRFERLSLTQETS